MPLEAIHDLFAMAMNKQTSPLLPVKQPDKNLTLVTKDFFQKSPNGISAESVHDDVLGFLSLVLSYAKLKDQNDRLQNQQEDESYKMRTSIMPRTDFTTIYGTVKESIPGSLVELVKRLACWKSSDGFKTIRCVSTRSYLSTMVQANILYSLDEAYCDQNFEPTNKLNSDKFDVKDSAKPQGQDESSAP